MHVVTDVDPEGKLQGAQIFRDALEGGPAAGEVSRCVVGCAQSVDGDLRGCHLASVEHVDNLLREQVAVRDDASTVLAATFLGQLHQSF